jgi:hypothetical protein
MMASLISYMSIMISHNYEFKERLRGNYTPIMFVFDIISSSIFLEIL